MWLQFYEQAGLGVLLTLAELSGMLRALEADTRRGRGTAEAQFLESYDGDGCTSLRVGKAGMGEVRSYSSCHVSLFGGVQDEVLRELINGSDASGKFARILMVKCPLKPLELKDDPISAEAGGGVRAGGKGFGFLCPSVVRASAPSVST